MRFSDFHVGQVLHLGPIRIEEADIIAFAKTYDPQWFHIDPVRAGASRWQGVIASGWHTCALAMRLICQAPLKDCESIGSPGLAYLKWPAPVRPGDELCLKAEVLEVRPSRNGRVGVLRWRWSLFNQNDDSVLDLEVTNLFELPIATG